MYLYNDNSLKCLTEASYLYLHTRRGICNTKYRYGCGQKSSLHRCQPNELHDCLVLLCVRLHDQGRSCFVVPDFFHLPVLSRLYFGKTQITISIVLVFF